MSEKVEIVGKIEFVNGNYIMRNAQFVSTTPVSGSSYQTFTGPFGTGFPSRDAFVAEWIEQNPDGWWPEPYEEERAWRELEAGHETMREWCEGNCE